jgi:predicted RND superfamily exporter protein
MLMFGAVILLTPGLFYLFPGFVLKDKTPKSDWWDRFLRLVLQVIFASQKQVLYVFLFVTIISLLCANQLKINGYILDGLPENSELLAEFGFFDREFGGSKPLEIHLERGASAKTIFDREVLEQIEKVEQFSVQTFGASNLVSPVFVAKFLNKAQNGGNEKAFRMPSRGHLERMQPLLAKWQDISPVRLFTEDQVQGRISGRTPDFGSYRSGKDKAKFDQFVSEEINPDLLRVRLTGTSHLIDVSHQNVTIQLAKGIGIAFIVVAIAVGFLFRSWLLPFLVLIPNILPLFWVAGFMWVIGAELSLSTAIIFTVAFGIAVDDTIHFMSKLKSEHENGKPWLYAIKRTYLETGKAIILTSAVLVSGFGILVFSQFGVTFYVGLLISLALFFALVCDMVLLPVLMIFYGKVKRSGSVFRNA